MNKKILITLGLIWSLSGFSQKILNGYTAPQTVVDGSTIRMLPGFHANSNDGSYTGTTNKFIAKIGNPDTETILPTTTIGNTNTNLSENYIYSRSYLVPVNTSNANAPQVQGITYFDGLGRPEQKIAIKANLDGDDLVTPIVYDGFGRQILDYLPVPQQGTQNGNIYQFTQQINTTPIAFPVSDAQNVYGNEKIYSEKTLENSPLDRIIQQKQVGNDWNSKPVTFANLANTKTGDKVMRFIATTDWTNQDNNDLKLDASKYFEDNLLYKSVAADEDGNTTIEFKNMDGKTVLVRRELSSTVFADSYYIYNDFDQLAYVLSPEASKKIDALTAGTSIINTPATNTAIQELCYQYRYDGKNRLVEKKLPGKEWEYLVYDRANRLILSQDANMRQDSKWLITKYDKFGRVVYTGIIPGTDRSAMQTQAGSLIITEDRSSTGFAQSGLQIYYSNNYFTDIETVLSVNYYDTYPSYADGLPVIGDYDRYGQKLLKQTYASSESNPNTQISTKGMLTASLVKTIDADSWTKNYVYYDQKSRPVYSQSKNHIGGYTITGSQLDFSGVVTQSFTQHKRGGTNITPEVNINERFAYDSQNRLLRHYHQVDNNSEVLLTENTYDKLGRLYTKKVGNNLQTMEFGYNIRGWLTGVNKNDISTTAPFTLNNNKLFAYELRYNDPKNTFAAAKRYNGNISEFEWITKEGSLKRYGYQYDKVNRLLAGIYQDPENSVPETHTNDEVLTYDLNGNIQTLVRKALGFKTNVNTIDDLTYHYTNGNKVTSITDGSGNPSGYEGGGAGILYDPNGNMTAMPDKGISMIAYNFLNLPEEVDQNANTTNYFYRADGAKIKKRFTLVNASGTKIINTEYLDGFQYSTPNTEPLRKALEETDSSTANSTTAGELEAFVTPEQRSTPGPGTPQTEDMILSFFSTSEGYYDYENLRYIYQYKDHLGNVRLSFTKTNTGDIKEMDTNEYYPFGMSFLKSTSGTSYYDPMAIPYNYKYNGKELQETGMYDYGARFYMPDIGRWGVVDPLAEKNTRWTTYNYAYNNPIRFIDPDGREGVNFTLDGDNAKNFFIQLRDAEDNRIRNNAFKIDGDIYSSSGVHLKNDGKKDNRVYVVDEKKIIKNGGTLKWAIKDQVLKRNLTNDELNLRASLSTLKQTEAGIKNEPLDYNTWNSGDNFTEDSYDQNPDAYADHPGRNPNSGGTAAGAYQALERFYKGSDFSPQSQDAAVLNNMTSFSFNAAKSGNGANFKTTTQARWTSLQHFTAGGVQNLINYYRAQELRGNSNIATPVGKLIQVRK